MVRKSILLDDKVMIAIDKKLAALGGLDFSAYIRHLIAEDLQNPVEKFLKNSYATQFPNRQAKLSEAEEIGISAAVETLFLCRKILAEMKDMDTVKRCAEQALEFIQGPLEKASTGE